MSPLSCVPHSSLPVTNGAGELRKSEGILSESAAQGRKELQSSLQIWSGLLPPRRLPEGSLLPEGVTQTGTFRSGLTDCGTEF